MNPSKKSWVLPLVLLIALLFALAAIAGYILYLGRTAELKTPESATPLPILTITASPAATAAPSPSETATLVPAAELTPAPTWQFSGGEKHFWQEGALRSENCYRSPTQSVTVQTVVDTETFGRRVKYYVADVYVRDITQIQTESCNGDFHRAGHGSVEKTAKRVNALLAISGDYYSAQSGSLVIRNGVVYRKSLRRDLDVCLLLKDGTMETIKGREAILNEILEKDPWQAWQFGPLLLNDEGDACTSFTGVSIAGRNPRCCIGYCDPGHYLFVVVDGRQKSSRGVTMKELAALMETLGCRRAFNLDGGASAHFFWQDTIFSNPSGGGRLMSDIIYVAKEDYPDAVYFHGKKGILS